MCQKCKQSTSNYILLVLWGFLKVQNILKTVKRKLLFFLFVQMWLVSKVFLASVKCSQFYVTSVYTMLMHLGRKMGHSIWNLSMSCFYFSFSSLSLCLLLLLWHWLLFHIHINGNSSYCFFPTFLKTNFFPTLKKNIN